MDHLSDIRINFDQGQVLILNICLGILMFGVALDLKSSDFGYLFKSRKAVLTGLLSQLVLLPVITVLLALFLRPAASLMLGMMLIAACPGGNVSNYAVHLARANTALSVVLTTISTLACSFTTPLIFSAGAAAMGNEALADFRISFLAMAATIVKLLLVPLAAGFLLNKYWPSMADNIRKPVKIISFLIFIGFLVFALAGNLQNLRNHLDEVFFIVLIHNGLALLSGYLFSSRVMKLNDSDAFAIAIETGIQNSGLALVLVFNFFGGEGGMALIAAWWSIWHLFSAFAMAIIRNARLKKAA